MSAPPRVLVCAGSDPLAYSGLQADLRHLSAEGLVGTGVPTCLTEQREAGVLDLVAVPPAHLGRALSLCLAEAPDAAKIGQVHLIAHARTLAAALVPLAGRVVLDPVLASGSGHSLAEEGLESALLDLVGALSPVVTPNAGELSRLVPQCENALAAAAALLARGARAVVLKGGHREMESERIEDLLVTEAGVRRFEAARVPGADVRGTGCAFATVLAAGLAKGLALEAACEHALARVQAAIRAAVARGDRRLLLA